VTAPTAQGVLRTQHDAYNATGGADMASGKTRAWVLTFFAPSRMLLQKGHLGAL